MRATCYEVLSYGPNKAIRTEFSRKLINSDLDGLIFDYAMPEPTEIPVGFGDAPLTMRAAQQVIEEGGAVVSEWSDIKVDIAQQQAQNDEQQAANNTQVATTLSGLQQQFAGATFRTYGAGVYIGSVEVRSAWVDANDGVFAYFDTAGTARFPAGVADLALPTAQIAALDVRALPGGYATDAVHVLSSDSTGQLALYVDSQGRVVAPGGVVSPNSLPAGIASDPDGMLRINGLRMVPTTIIDCEGDSLTGGTGSSGGQTYPVQLSALLGGRTVNNRGQGGTTSTAIAARQDALRTWVTVEGNTIPASGSVNITSVSTELLTGSGDFTSVGWLAGVYGTLRKINFAAAPGNGYTFTRAASGAAVDTSAMLPGALFKPDEQSRQENIKLIWSGTNDARWLKNPDGSPLPGADGKPQIDYASMERALGNVRAMVESLRTARKRFGLIEMLNGTGEGSDSTGTGLTNYQFVIEYNRRLRDLYPGSFIPIRYRLCDPTTGRLRPEYASDLIHLLNSGYAIVAQECAAYINWRGW
ncbi:hypothetical protein [Deinococcus knuensis]|uniref:SGNH hydrolase-type esterase domain-containing protein n=1 Tax=Deinococcus knuensis TaxID=1837380 RepID=A0ABQ2SEP0_9DEIO|nr:hypothetical protein [Deinococcus knuensis]GGS26057.1 hypothetical protein GCM10008961_16960 [Deinococcus knuensis]